MPRSTDLRGRDALLRQVAARLTAGRSVLLYGPEGMGKSAIVAALARDGVVVMDPFEHVNRQQASQMRRALDRGAVYLGATRATSRRALGAVGRILWRFSMIRVRELPDPILGRIVTQQLRRAIPAVDVDRTWLHEVVTLTKGRPGFATVMARFAVEWHRRHGYLPPALMFVATREDAAIRMLQPIAARPQPLAKSRL